MKPADALRAMRERDAAAWRDPAQVASYCREAAALDPRLFESRASADWWDLLGELGVTLLVTREYEHFALALSAPAGRPSVTFFPLPHPSGVAVDRRAHTVSLASTRNPNQLFVFKPAQSLLERTDVRTKALPGSPLTPVSTAFYPGCLYLHDLALSGGALYANAVGHNAVVRLAPDGRFERAWWPKCIERRGRPVFSSNYIQLNSIAAGRALRDSFFTASSCSLGRRRPGDPRYPVDRRGVLFSGRTREPVCSGLTRPHSARFHHGEVWLANSGYGELGFVRGAKFEAVANLAGWTRGLCLVKDVAFVATSRVIPEYASYAPGLDCSRSRCALHAISSKSGRTMASLEWPWGNQIFAIDWISSRVSTGFPFPAASRNPEQEKAFFYRYQIHEQ